MAIVRKFVRNPEIVKDLTQEIFIRAYLNYDYYTETGKIKSWLSVIANNKLKNYYKAEHYRNERIEFVALEDFTKPSEETPENITEQKDFTEQILKIINTLPQKQRDAVFYSVIHNYSEYEIAAMKNIPVGSVKSAKHYGLEKVKKLIIQNNLVNRKVNDMSKLNKQEAYALLYQYAKGHISSEDKTAVEEYMKTDGEAANIAEALRELYPKLTYARDDETTHYNLKFGLSNGDHICYAFVSFRMEDYQRMNEYLEIHDGYTPENETWLKCGYKGASYVTVFDNEGNKIEPEHYYDADKDHHWIHAKRMKRVFSVQHINTVYYTEKKGRVSFSAINKSSLAPNLYEAKTQNCMGNAAKSAIYLALPGEATNIRMIRGNGILDCGKYKFVYADRYVTAEESIFAECTFNM